jgi:hypothetical protein
MSLALFHYLLLNMFRILVHSSSGACDLLWIYLMSCIALDRCRLKLCFSLHNDTTPPQPNHTVTPTHIDPEHYNPWDKSTISRKLLKMKVLTFETCWAVNSEIIKQVTSRWSIFIHYQDDARSNKHNIMLELKVTISKTTNFKSDYVRN